MKCVSCGKEFELQSNKPIHVKLHEVKLHKSKLVERIRPCVYCGYEILTTELTT